MANVGSGYFWNVDAAVEHLNTNAKPQSLGKCAHYVSDAIDAGGIKMIRTNSAKDFGSLLLSAGFIEIPSTVPVFNKGDVAIIQPIQGHPHGHMTMFNGTQWVSDFKQNFGYYPGQSYRNLKPPVKFYRFRGL